MDLHYVLCLRLSRGILEDEKPQCGARNDNFFFCVSAATTAYNSLPGPRRDVCKTWSGVKIRIQLFSFLSCPQLSYFARHSTLNQLSTCQKATSTVHSLIYPPRWLVAEKQRRKKDQNRSDCE